MLVMDLEKVWEVIFLLGIWKGFEMVFMYVVWNFLKNCKCIREIRENKKKE